MGGIGTTQVAITYAKRDRHSYPSTFCMAGQAEEDTGLGLIHPGGITRMVPIMR